MVDKNLTQQLIKDISSSLARADIANRIGDKPDELKNLLYAIQDICVLLHNLLNDRVDAETAKTYVIQLENCSKRAKELLEAGVITVTEKEA